jgi:hypothetical protein
MRTNLGRQIQNNPIAFPISGTALGVCIDVTCNRDSFSPFVFLQPFTDDILNAAIDARDGARGITSESGVIPGNPAIWDHGGLSCNSKGAFQLGATLIPTGSGPTSLAKLRINGSSVTDLTFQRQYSYTTVVGADSNANLTGAGYLNSGDLLQVRFECIQPQANVGARVIRVRGFFSGPGFSFDTAVRLNNALEIDSVGVEIVGGKVINSAFSSWTLTRRIAP